MYTRQIRVDQGYLPPRENNPPYQLFRRPVTLFYSSSKNLIHRLPPNGTPRYVIGHATFLQPIVSIRWLMDLSPTLIPISNVFPKLNFSPNIWSNTWRMAGALDMELLSFSKNIVSSTNWRWETSKFSMPTFKHFTKFLSVAFDKILLNISATRVKRNDESGLPCLSPLETLNQSYYSWE